MKKIVSITLPAEQVEEAQAFATELGISLSTLYRWPILAFHDYLEAGKGRIICPFHIEPGEVEKTSKNTAKFPPFSPS